VSNVGHFAIWEWDILFAMMGEDIHILKVEKDGEDGLTVVFSDGTIAGYVAEELLLLRPIRERVEEPVDSNKPTAIVGHHCAHQI
jgi:hypothetical protein